MAAMPTPVLTKKDNSPSNKKRRRMSKSPSKKFDSSSKATFLQHVMLSELPHRPKRLVAIRLLV